jgi:hypothetical protein
MDGDYISNYQHTEELEAYAKIEGPNIKHLVTKLVVYLGRDNNNINPDNEDEQICFIGDSQKISRKHAKIFWNHEKCTWEMIILSKNKAVVNGVSLRKDDVPYALIPRSSIKIDKFKFYFFPAYKE